MVHHAGAGCAGSPRSAAVPPRTAGRRIKHILKGKKVYCQYKVSFLLYKCHFSNGLNTFSQLLIFILTDQNTRQTYSYTYTDIVDV